MHMISKIKLASKNSTLIFSICFFYFTLLFGLVSCKKGGDEPIVPDPTTERQLELTKKEISNSNFVVDENIIEQIYVGNILRVEASNSNPGMQLAELENYTKLPIRLLVLDELPIKTTSEIPSFLSTQHYAEHLDDYETVHDKFVPSTWHPIVDFRALIVPFGLQEDIIDILNTVESTQTDSDEIDSKYSVLVSYHKQDTYTLSMELPTKTELISVADEKRLLADNPSSYYVNTVTYGRVYMLIVKSLDSEENVRSTMKALFEKKKMNPEQKETLEKTRVTVYLRTGKHSEKLLSEGTGEVGISNVVSEFIEEYENTDNQYTFPVSYTLRRLGDLSLFKHTYWHEWYIDKK